MYNRWESIPRKNTINSPFWDNYPQIKFISVLKGKILDCVIDLRKNSKTFGKTFKIEISENSNFSIFRSYGHAPKIMLPPNKKFGIRFRDMK